MAGISAKLDDRSDSSDFAALLNETIGENANFEGSVVKGRIIGFTPDSVMVDVGLKAEGRIPLKEFGAAGQNNELQAGDEVEVYVERMENRDGEAVLSREKARREEAWVDLEKAYQEEAKITGVIFGKVKGGLK